MSRKSLQGRRQANAKWPALQAALNAHFGERFWMQHDSFAAARKAANEQLDHPERKQVLREWWDWNATAGSLSDPRAEIACLGVEPPFGTVSDARTFMNEFYDALIVDVRSKEPGWKP